jgi:RNA polymerase sigma-70 factor (ECF subfamily)
MATMGEGIWSSEFVERFRTGDAEALRVVYDAHMVEITRVARRFLGPRAQNADVEDVVQEVFSRAFTQTARNGFDASLRYGAYVGTIARNVLIDWARQKQREPVVEPESQLATTALALVPSLDDSVMKHVSLYLARCAPDLLRICELRYVEGRTQREICDSLGVTRQELRTKELRLLRALRREMKSP